MSPDTLPEDKKTADAFAQSWNHLPEGSVYTYEQFADWMAPLTKDDVSGKRVIEFGCGNASLLLHMLSWKPALLRGVELGDSVLSARANMQKDPNAAFVSWDIVQADLTHYREGGYDLVFCIGVLHHLKEPKKGFEAMLANTRPGGRFHGWVYAYEGNAIIRYIVDPIRRVASHLPWWFTKHVLATTLVTPYFFYAHVISRLPRTTFGWLPLYDYSVSIARRDFHFFRHVAFDQLVTPQTAYLKRSVIESWLKDPRIDQSSTYIIFRNGNSWKFGGRVTIDTTMASTETVRRLNLGCAGTKKEGYVNVDFQPSMNPDVVHDLNVFPYPFEDNSFDLIEAFHVLEHLDRPFLVMKELHRILKPSGTLHVKVPHFSRGMTHAEHAHGFDITFPLYFNADFATFGYFGTDFELKKMELHWAALFRILPHLGFGSFVLGVLKTLNSIITFLANLSPALCSRVWCFWVGGFEEIEFIFECKK